MFLNIISSSLFLITLPGSCELLFLSIGAIFPTKKILTKENEKKSVAVIIPAHNEEAHLTKTIESLKKCPENFDIIVIADNCTDNTANIAAECGAMVLERNNKELQGKNYALEYAFNKLLTENYEIFAVVDADTIVKSNFITTIKNKISSTALVIQTRDDIVNKKNRLAVLGFLAFNLVRPRGRAFWGLSTGILGNGFAIHKKVLIDIPYAVDSIVEDLTYHLKLVEKGYKVHFIEETGVKSMSPDNKEGEQMQRHRWEGGRFKEIYRSAPGLINLIFRGNLFLIEPLLDLLLLPLSYHVCLLLIILFIPIWSLQIYAIASLFIVLFHFIAAIFLSDEKMKNSLSLISAPVYILWKVRILPKILWNALKKNNWIRTSRDTK